MTIASGVAAQLAFKKETTKNTRVTPDHWVEFNQESVMQKIARLESKGLRAGRRANHGWSAGSKWIEGSINLELVPNSTAALLELYMGGTVVTAGVNPYTHTMSPGDLKSFTLQIGRPSTDGTVRPFDYLGCMVDSWSISDAGGTDGSFIESQCSIIGYSEDTAQTLATPSYPTVTRWTTLSAALTVAGSAFCVDSWSIGGTNGLERLHQACAADAGKPKVRESGQRVYSGTLTADFDSLTAYNRFTAGTEAALVITLGSGSAMLVITTNVRFDGDTPNVSGPTVLKQVLPFVCTGSTDAAAITWVLTNTDATP